MKWHVTRAIWRTVAWIAGTVVSVIGFLVTAYITNDRFRASVNWIFGRVFGESELQEQAQ